MKAKLYTKGNSRGDPGPAACSFILVDVNEAMIDEDGKYIGEEENLVAEYSGVIIGLISARHHRVSELYVISDSELMVRQIKNKEKIKDLNLKQLLSMVYAIIPFFSKIEFIVVPQTKNLVTSQLVNEILDENRKDNNGSN